MRKQGSPNWQLLIPPSQFLLCSDAIVPKTYRFYFITVCPHCYCPAQPLFFFFSQLGHCMEKAMAPHSSSLAWKIPWMEEPSRLQSMGSLRVRHDWATSLSLFTFMHWRRKCVLAWRIPGMGEPGGLLSRGSHRVRHDWSDLAAAPDHCNCFWHYSLPVVSSPSSSSFSDSGRIFPPLRSCWWLFCCKIPDGSHLA